MAIVYDPVVNYSAPWESGGFLNIFFSSYENRGKSVRFFERMHVLLKSTNPSARLKGLMCSMYRVNVTSDEHNDSLQWHMVPGPEGNHDK